MHIYIYICIYKYIYTYIYIYILGPGSSVLLFFNFSDSYGCARNSVRGSGLATLFELITHYSDDKVVYLMSVVSILSHCVECVLLNYTTYFLKHERTTQGPKYQERRQLKYMYIYTHIYIYIFIFVLVQLYIYEE